MKNMLIVFVGVFLAMVLVVSQVSLAEEEIQKPEEVSKVKRNPYNFGLGLAAGVFESVGLEGALFVAENWSIDANIGTMLWFNTYTLGARHFITPKKNWSFYLFGKAGYLICAKPSKHMNELLSLVF